ncbi:MAG TPA: tRNA-binding protein [Dehalococcoidia bacterium]
MNEAALPTIGVEQFQQVDVRVGRVLAVEEFPEARRPSYRLTLDFGPLGVRRSSAAIRPFYAKEELAGRLVVAVVNLPPRRVAGFVSEVLVLGAVDGEGRVRLLRPDEGARPGDRVA